MAAIAAIANGGGGLLMPDGLLALEIDERRAAEAAALVEGTGMYQQVAIHKDLTGRERFVMARRKES
jgi:methylase of polypeptide subunit release factors